MSRDRQKRVRGDAVWQATRAWLQRTNLWRERTNLRTGAERLRGVTRRLDPEALAYFGPGHPWWRHPRPRTPGSSPEQSWASQACLPEEGTNEETTSSRNYPTTDGNISKCGTRGRTPWTLGFVWSMANE